MIPDSAFDRSVREQIRINQARTPTERFLALCDLLDSVRALAPAGEEARQRRLRALAIRQQERERFRAEYRRLFAAQRAGRSLAVASAEGLIVRKLIAMRPQDEADVQNLLTAHAGKLDLEFIRTEMETFTESDDPRRAKFAAWVNQSTRE